MVSQLNTASRSSQAASETGRGAARTAPARVSERIAILEPDQAER